MYKYHAQYQALEYANSILPVPENYPLKKGLNEGFGNDFKELTEFARVLYRDIAEVPEEYGVLTHDVNDQNSGKIGLIIRGPIRDSWLSLRKPVDVLYALSYSGKIEGDILKADARIFVSKIKEMKLTRYNSILDRLANIGFVFGGYANKKIQDDFITVSFPKNPKILKTLKAYCECRMIEEEQKNYIKTDMDFYTFDYKYTANLSMLPEIDWVKDKIYFWDSKAKEFYIAFYQYMIKNTKAIYKSDDFHSDFCINGYMAARLRYEDDYWRQDIRYLTNSEYREKITRGMNVFFALILYLPIKDEKHKSRFDILPPHIIEYMKKQKCIDCNAFPNYKKKSGGICPYTVVWEHDNVECKSCVFGCFHYENPKIEDIPVYCDMLATEYEKKPGSINRHHVRE